MIVGKKQMAIIGGGPGGLTLARLLQLKGADVKVYERDQNREARIQGGALDLHTESGLAALDNAGLMPAFKQRYRPDAGFMRVVDNQATIHLDEHMTGKAETFGDMAHRPEIDRGPLRDILIDSLQPGTIEWDSHIVSLEQPEGKWKLRFQNGHTVVADIVIGADGASSRIRPFVTDIQAVWAGVTMVEGSIKDSATTASHIHQLLKGGKIFAFGNERTLIVSSKGNGSLGFTTSCKTEEYWYKNSGIDFRDNRQVLAWFKKEYHEWSPVWQELFECETTLFIPRPQYCMPLDQRWDARPDITLIGDAAHWMPPFAGEGVNMAMLDALQLSENLTSDRLPGLQEAIGDYEKKMFERFAQVGADTLFNTEWMHGQHALEDMLKMFAAHDPAK